MAVYFTSVKHHVQKVKGVSLQNSYNSRDLCTQVNFANINLNVYDEHVRNIFLIFLSFCNTQ